jgi:protein PET117
MGRLAQVSLVGAVALTTATIWFVHHQQTDERVRMHAGVLRDDERRKEKMEQRLKLLQESQERRAIYEKVQKVEPVLSTDSSS